MGADKQWLSLPVGGLKKLKAYFNNLRLRRKLMLIYTLVAFLPLLLISILLIRKANEIILDQASSRVNITMQQLAQNIENKLESYLDIADHLYFNQRLNGYLAKKQNNVYENLEVFEYYQDLLKGHTVYRNDIRSILFYVSNNSLYESDILHDVSADMSQLPEYRSILQAGIEGYWSKPVKVAINGTYWNAYIKGESQQRMEWVICYSRLLDTIGFVKDPHNFVSIEIKEEQLFTLIEEEGKNNEIFLVDSQGVVITSNVRDMIGASLDTAGFYPLVQGQSGTFDWQAEENDFMGMYKTLSNNWKLISLISVGDLLLETQEMTRFGLIFILACILLSIIIITLLSTWIVKRMNRLMHKIDSFQDDHMQYLQSAYDNDEIGELDRSFDAMSERIRRLIHEVYDLNVMKKQAELDALQSQVNPHFLYNALSTVNWMTLKCSGEEIREIVSDIATFYRISLSNGRDMITIADEINCVKAYLGIQRYRTHGKITAYYFIDKNIESVPVPKIILQPLVENCIVHGMGDEDRPIMIAIKGCVSDASIVLQVDDDGIGINGKQIGEWRDGKAISSSSGNGYGLRNVDQRIKLHFGDGYGVCLDNRAGGGTTVTIRIPYRSDESCLLP